ncbi:MAG: hypothetical protein O7D91_02870 [Planctomycetota bacterium]|nr:hypothetical protein [Planctomycetota bacterium]
MIRRPATERRSSSLVATPSIEDAKAIGGRAKHQGEILAAFSAPDGPAPDEVDFIDLGYEAYFRKKVLGRFIVYPETEGIPAVRAMFHSIAGHRKVARAAMCVAHKQSRRMGVYNQQLLRRRVGRSR